MNSTAAQYFRARNGGGLTCRSPWVSPPAAFGAVPGAVPGNPPYWRKTENTIPTGLRLPRGFQPAPAPWRVSLPWSVEVSIPARCRARVFKTRCRAVGKRSVLVTTAGLKPASPAFGGPRSVQLSYVASGVHLAHVTDDLHLAVIPGHRSALPSSACSSAR